MCDFCPSPYGWKQPGGVVKCNDCLRREEIAEESLSTQKKKNKILQEQNRILQAQLDLLKQTNMKEQQIRDEFKKLVIEKIHGLPYEEVSDTDDVTLSRVMNVLDDIKIDDEKYGVCTIVVSSLGEIGIAKRVASIASTFKIDVICNWKLLKQDGDTATDEEQSIETIKSLLELIK